MTLNYEVEKPLVIRQEEFITEELQYQFRYNVVRDIFEYKLPNTDWQDVKERIYKTIRRQFKLSTNFRGKGECPTVNTLYELVDTPLMSPEYNPFEDFFYNNKWDGKDRIKELLETVIIADVKLKDFDLPHFWPMLFTKWLVAAVACVLGVQANHVMLLFISEAHGTYKSSWLTNLCPPSLLKYIHFGHIIPQLTDNNTANIVAEKVICNIDDQLDSIFGKDFNAIKSVITAPFVTNRKSFRRDDNKRVRRVNFVGSVNNTDIFRDSQNRRYLTFEIKKILWLIAKEIDMDQVWFQAYHSFKNGAQIYFDKGDEEIINQINDYYSLVSNEQDWFLKLFEISDKADMEAKFFPPSEILSIIKRASGLNVYQNNLSIALKRLGVQKAKQRINFNGNNQPRDGYWLIENFKRNGENIQPHEQPPGHDRMNDY